MYRNPLNNGDLSDYNSLKNQIDYGSIIKEYQVNRPITTPTELQKYYEFETYERPILDELNYVAERMKNENIKKQKEDFEFIQKLKEQKEALIPKKVENKIRNDLFDYPQNSVIDLTPTIITDNELEDVLSQTSTIRKLEQPPNIINETTKKKKKTTTTKKEIRSLNLL